MTFTEFKSKVDELMLKAWNSPDVVTGGEWCKKAVNYYAESVSEFNLRHPDHQEFNHFGNAFQQIAIEFPIYYHKNLAERFLQSGDNINAKIYFETTLQFLDSFYRQRKNKRYLEEKSRIQVILKNL